MGEREKLFPSESKVTEAAAEHLFAHVCRHLVCLAVQYVELDEKGCPKGQEKFIAYSAFVMSMNDRWFLVTAGHALKELDSLLDARRIKITSCCIADYFGKDAKVHYPTPFPYDESSPRWSIDDRLLGLDLGLVYLRKLYRDGMEANGIMPVSERNWVRQHEVAFDAYYILGFPKELVDQHTKPADLG
jgi:hypothetical protein